MPEVHQALKSLFDCILGVPKFHAKILAGLVGFRDNGVAEMVSHVLAIVSARPDVTSKLDKERGNLANMGGLYPFA